VPSNWKEQIKMSKNIISKVLGLVGALVVGVATQNAHAGQVTSCSVQFVRVVNEHVIVRCTTGTEYNIWGSGFTSCNSRLNSDTYKIAATLAQSAYLAGKTLTMNFNDTDNTCPATANAVTLIQIGTGL
jgi:hypothetical protein